MTEDKVFQVVHPTGHLDVRVGSFFGGAEKSRVNKLLRLARQHCSDGQRLELLSALEYEAERRKSALTELEALRGSIYDQLAMFFTEFAVPPLNYEKVLKKQFDKLTETAELLKKERWSDDTSLD